MSTYSLYSLCFLFPRFIFPCEDDFKGLTKEVLRVVFQMRTLLINVAEESLNTLSMGMMVLTFLSIKHLSCQPFYHELWMFHWDQYQSKMFGEIVIPRVTITTERIHTWMCGSGMDRSLNPSSFTRYSFCQKWVPWFLCQKALYTFRQTYGTL